MDSFRQEGVLQEIGLSSLLTGVPFYRQNMTTMDPHRCRCCCCYYYYLHHDYHGTECGSPTKRESYE